MEASPGPCQINHVAQDMCLPELIIVDEKDGIADVLIRDVQALGFHSVGIAEIDTDDLGKCHIHQKPELAAQPDRQAQTVREIMGQGIPDLVEF